MSERTYIALIAMTLALAFSQVRADPRFPPSTGNPTGNYLLYRTSSMPGVAHVYIASFDAEGQEGDAEYNRQNCETAARLFESQSGTEDYFCLKEME